MVVLTVTPFKGSGSRAFPSVGFLGLGPVSLAGAVRVKLQEDNRPVQASSLVVRVRCYESMGSGSGSPTTDGATSSFSSSSSAANPYPSSSTASGSSRPAASSSSASLVRNGSSNGSAASASAPSPLGTQPGVFTEMLRGNNNGRGKVLYEKSITLWSSTSSTTSNATASDPEEHGYPPRAANHTHFAPLGNFEKAWRLVIPPDAVEHGAKSTQIFKNWRIWWAVEAVISHIPLGMHGDRIIKTHQLSLINYAPLPPIPRMDWTSAQAPTATFDFNIDGPPGAVGASDPIAFQMRIRKNGTTSDVPKKVVIEFHRDLVYATGDLPSSSSTQTEEPRRSSVGRRGSNFTLASHSNVSRKRSSGSGFYDILPPLSADSFFVHRTPPQAIPTPVDFDETSAENYFGFFPAHHRKGSLALEMAQQQHHFHMQQQDAASAVKRRREDVVLASYTADVRFNSEGTWSGTVEGMMPKAKSVYHYALGETCFTKNASSRFYFVVKHRSRSHVHELPPRDIFFSTVSNEERAKAVAELPKLELLQKAERQLLGVRADPCEEPANSETMSIKSSNVRRRSEQPEQLELPRVRPRFGSTPNGNLTPILGSPVLPFQSPAPSTARPRTANSRKQAASSSPRTSRPRSAGGVSMSGVSAHSPSSPQFFTLLNTNPPSPVIGVPQNFDSPRSISAPSFPYQQYRAGEDENKPPPLPVNQLFANFAGFAPAEKPQSAPLPVQDVYIAPKPGVPVPKTSSKHQQNGRGLHYTDPPSPQASPFDQKHAPIRIDTSATASAKHPPSKRSPAFQPQHKTSSPAVIMQRSDSRRPPPHLVVSPSQPLATTHSSSSSSASSFLNPATKKKSGFSAGFSFFRKTSKV